jgi:hypothetical protein
MGFTTGALLMAAGTGLSAYSAYQQGRYAAAQAEAQARISDYNAQVAEANAEAIKQKSIFDQLRALKKGQRRLGELRAKQGVSGAVMSEGAPADVLAEQGFENALDVALIGYEGIVGAKRQKSIASMYRYEAANYLQQAENAKRAGLIGAGTSLLTGFGTMYGLGMFDKSPLTLSPENKATLLKY